VLQVLPTTPRQVGQQQAGGQLQIGEEEFSPLPARQSSTSLSQQQNHQEQDQDQDHQAKGLLTSSCTPVLYPSSPCLFSIPSSSLT